MKTANTICFFAYGILLIVIVYFSLSHKLKTLNNYPIKLSQQQKDSLELEQERIEALVAIPEQTLIMHQALYDASQITCKAIPIDDPNQECLVREEWYKELMNK